MFFLIIFVPTIHGDNTTISVKDFGAVGNGIADDTQAIQEALNNASGKTVLFPTGTYAVGSLEVKENATLIGTNATLKAKYPVTRFFMVGQGNRFNYEQMAPDYYEHKAPGKNVSVSGLTFDGNNQVLTGIFIINGSENISIQNVTIQNISSKKALEAYPISSGIRMEGNTKNITIDSVKIKNVYAKTLTPAQSPNPAAQHYIARGVFLMPKSITDAKNKIEKAPQNIVIKNSDFDGIGPKDDGDGINVQNFKQPVNLKIINNTFKKVHKRAIKIQDPGAYIYGNKIYNSFSKNNYYQTYKEKNDYDMFSAISIYADNVVIEKNIANGIGSYSAVIDIDSAKNIKVINNQFSNGDKSNYKNYSLIRINYVGKWSYPSNITVTGNTLKNGKYGIYYGVAGAQKNIVVKNNKIINCVKEMKAN